MGTEPEDPAPGTVLEIDGTHTTEGCLCPWKALRGSPSLIQAWLADRLGPDALSDPSCDLRQITQLPCALVSLRWQFPDHIEKVVSQVHSALGSL